MSDLRDEQQIRHDLSSVLWACLRDGGGFTSAAMEIVRPIIADRDAAVARAEAAEQALQRVRAETAEAIAQAILARAKDGTWNVGGQVVLEIAAGIAREHALDGTP